jgi:hypothetical protein
LIKKSTQHFDDEDCLYHGTLNCSVIVESKVSGFAQFSEREKARNPD